jgi:hypothetical protein
MDPNIDNSQASRLSGLDRQRFEKHAKEVLEYFGYA